MHEPFQTPGQLIQALLDERGWQQRVLALVLRVSEPVVNRMVSGGRPIDPEMALLLEQAFNVPAERFLALQQSYDLAMARQLLQPDPARATRAMLFRDLPVAEMIRRRWLDAEDIRDVTAVEASLVKFFGVETVDEIEILPHASKKTDTIAPAKPAQLAWIHRVRHVARDMLVGRYSPAAVQAAIPKLQALLSAPEESRHVPRILSECGIRFVIVETLSSAKIDGVCFWLNDLSPVVGMTLRFDRIDNYWFVLRHELEHVLRRHGRAATYMLDAELEGDRAGTGENIAEEERVANEAASDFCVPRKALRQLVERKAPLFAERDILGFARTLRIHPGLVAGQLQNETRRYDRFRSHLAKIRHLATQGAIVDGWGDVAPVDN